MGKNWARGLTKSTDDRVARAASSHRGLRYVRRTPIEQCRWTWREPRVITQWSDALAYAVGLIATDGCLASSSRLITLVSKDVQLLQAYLGCLGRNARLARHGSGAHRVQFKDADFYRWLVSIGVTPRKSLTLGAIDVPDEFLLPLVRGLLDGDGSVLYQTVVPNPRMYPLSTYPRINVRFVSASRPHLEWLAERLRLQLAVTGAIHEKSRRDVGQNPIYELKFGKYSSIVLLRELYRDPDAPRLDRKWRTWNRYLTEARPTRIWTRHAGVPQPAEGSDSKSVQ